MKDGLGFEQVARRLKSPYPRKVVPGDGFRWLLCGRRYSRPGLNHLAYEVDDIKPLRARLRAAGYRDSTVPNAQPYRKRVYFHDPEGNDREFVQYLSDDAAKRHDYELPDP